MAEQRVVITTEYITLDGFLKWVGVAGTGGQAKALILSGAVRVNGEEEHRRGRKLYPGDHVDAGALGQWVITRGEA